MLRDFFIFQVIPLLHGNLGRNNHAPEIKEGRLEAQIMYRPKKAFKKGIETLYSLYYSLSRNVRPVSWWTAVRARGNRMRSGVAVQCSVLFSDCFSLTIITKCTNAVF